MPEEVIFQSQISVNGNQIDFSAACLRHWTMFVLIISFSGPYMFICVLFMAKYHQIGLE